VLAGQNRELAESFNSLRFALLLAIFLVYLVMGEPVRVAAPSVRDHVHAAVALTGVVLILLATGTPVSVMGSSGSSCWPGSSSTTASC